LLIAAADLPGEATDEVRAMTYGLVVLYVTSGQASGRGMDPQGVSVQPAKPVRQPAAGIRDPAGTSATGTG
jgi:hypothetical protein